MGRVGAFFDMDKTLIDENSGSLYMKHRYERGEISALELAKGLGAYLQYKAGILDIVAWTKEMLAEFAGRSVAEIQAEAEDWLIGELIAHLYPEARSLVEHHQDADHLVAIVSGSTDFVVAPLARYLGIEHVLATRLEHAQGAYTGVVVEPVCFEEGKVHWLSHLVAEHDIDLARSWFYTDSITDLPLLELVGHPVVVNPDPRLYREAARRRWPVRMFASPEAPAAGVSRVR